MPSINIVFCFLCFSIKSFGQALITNYSVEHYTSNNGLPQNSIKAISRDNFGFFWLATEVGLVRFDGRKFLQIHETGFPIASNRFVGILKVHGSNNLFAISSGREVVILKEGRASAYNGSADSLLGMLPMVRRVGSEMYISKVSEPPHAFVYITDNDRYLRASKEKVEWFAHEKRYASIKIRHFFDNRSAFAYGENLYYIPLNRKGFSIAVLTPKGEHNNISLSGDRPKKNKYNHFIRNYSAGQTFLVQENCIYLIDEITPDSLRIKLVLAGFDFKGMAIEALYYDRENNMLLAGSLVEGLYVFKEKMFLSTTKIMSNPLDNSVLDQLAFNDSSILTDKGFLISSGVKDPITLPIPHGAFPVHLLKCADQSIWISHGANLYQYCKNLTKIYRQWENSENVTALAEIGDQVWYGLYSGDILSIPSSKAITAKPQKIASLKGQINAFVNGDSCVLVGTDRGLYYINKTNHEINSEIMLQGKEIRALYKSGNDPNSIWICTYGSGLWLLQSNNITRFPSNRNNDLDMVHAALEDEKGYLWISTNNGIFQSRIEDMFNYISKGKIPFYLKYGKESGLETSEFNGGSNGVAIKLSNGYFSFASIKGIVLFNPDYFSPISTNSNIVIDNMEIDGRSVKVCDSISIAKDFSLLSITMATFYLGNAKNVIYEYCLDNKTWTSIPGNNISLNFLPPGEHLLKIRMHVGLNKGYQYKTIRIWMQPKWWETGWFGVLMFLGIILAIWIVFRIRFYFLRKNNLALQKEVRKQTVQLTEHIDALQLSEEKLKGEILFQERLSRQIAHDIRTPLKYLTISMENLNKKLSNLKDPNLFESGNIYSSSKQVYQFVDSLVVFLQTKSAELQIKKDINMANIVWQKFKILELAAKAKNCTLINYVPKSLHIYNFDNYVGMVLHNLIDNAIKNSTGGSVVVRAAWENGHPVIIVSDTGRGMSKESMDEYNRYFNDPLMDNTLNHIGLGFFTIKNMLPIMNSSLYVYTNSNNGCDFHLSFKA